MDITQYWIRVEAGTSAGSPWPSWAPPTSTHPDSSQDVKCLICRRVGDRMMWPIPFLLHCAVRVPCRMCYIRLAAILSITRRNSVRPDLVHSYFYLQNSIMTIVYRRQGQGQIADASMPFFPAESPFTIELYSCPDATSLLPHVGVGRAFMEERTSMYATLTKRRFWECSQNMPLCGPHLQRLPPRVIDVGTLQSPTLRLYETGRDHGAYVVLSHTPSSWPRALRTTTENLLDHVDEVRLFGLPSPIFRDAISVTRGLGIRYLWIGSLCVVQGDEDDRANHIEQYESIYDQARLVISARAENRIHDSGLFPDPNMHRIATIYNGYSTYAVRARLLGEPRGHVCGTSKLIQYNWPWFWNLQDQLLSSRILHFTDSELQWECRCRLACQCTPGSRGLDNSLYLKAWYNHLIDRRLRGHDVDTEVYKFWWFMLHKYSSLDFPSQSDILLSISALARQIQRKLGTGEYVAGMFKNDAPRNLLWKRRMSRFRPIGYVAPSWSWASRIVYPRESYESKPDLGNPSPVFQLLNTVHKNPGVTYAEVLQMVAHPSGNDTFGPVSSGHITLRGQLIGMTYLGLPITLHKSSTKDDSRWICRLHPNETYVYASLDFDPTLDEAEKELLLLLISKESYSRGSRTKRRMYWDYKGLILTKHTRDSRLWERVGVWEVPISEEQNDMKMEEFFPTSYKSVVSIV